MIAGAHQVFTSPGSATPPSAAYSDWDLYRFGLLVGFGALVFAPREALMRLMLPIEYVRCAEARCVLKQLAVTVDHFVLDYREPEAAVRFPDGSPSFGNGRSELLRRATNSGRA